MSQSHTPTTTGRYQPLTTPSTAADEVLSDATTTLSQPPPPPPSSSSSSSSSTSQVSSLTPAILHQFALKHNIKLGAGEHTVPKDILIGSLRIPARWAGVSLLVISSLLFSIMSLFVSLIPAEKMSSFQLVWVRCLQQMTYAFIFLRVKGIAVFGPREKRFWLVLRGTAGFLSFSCLYFAVQMIQLADATTLFFSNPIIAGALSRIILHERWGLFELAASSLSLGGVIFVSRPSVFFGNQSDNSVSNGSTDHAQDSSNSTNDGNATAHTFGVMVALLGACLSASVFIIIRRIGAGVHPLVLVFYMGFTGFVSVPITAFFQVWRVPGDIWIWLYIFGIGITAFVGQILFNAGVQMEKAGLASLIRTLDVMFAFFWQITILAEPISGWSFLGAALISTGVILVGWKKIKTEREEKQKRKLEAQKEEDLAKQQQEASLISTTVQEVSVELSSKIESTQSSSSSDQLDVVKLDMDQDSTYETLSKSDTTAEDQPQSLRTTSPGYSNKVSMDETVPMADGRAAPPIMRRYSDPTDGHHHQLLPVPVSSTQASINSQVYDIRTIRSESVGIPASNGDHIASLSTPPVTPSLRSTQLAKEEVMDDETVAMMAQPI